MISMAMLAAAGFFMNRLFAVAASFCFHDFPPNKWDQVYCIAILKAISDQRIHLTPKPS